MVSAMPYRECDTSDAHLLPAVIPDGSIYFPQKLFVGGLSHPTTCSDDKTVSEHDLKEFFQQFGQVTEVKFICHHEDGSFRGFAFVTFESDAVVKKIVNLFKDVSKKSLFSIKGVELKIGFAVRKGNGLSNNSNSSNKRPAMMPAGGQPVPAVYNQNAAAAALMFQLQAQLASFYQSAAAGLAPSPQPPPATGYPSPTSPSQQFLPYTSTAAGFPADQCFNPAVVNSAESPNMKCESPSNAPVSYPPTLYSNSSTLAQQPQLYNPTLTAYMYAVNSQMAAAAAAGLHNGLFVPQTAAGVYGSPVGEDAMNGARNNGQMTGAQLAAQMSPTAAANPPTIQAPDFRHMQQQTNLGTLPGTGDQRGATFGNMQPLNYFV